MMILVSGATGLIGRSLVKELAARGDEVVAISRRPGNGAIAWSDVGGAIERADAVVHLAGEPITSGRWTADRLARIRSSRVDTTGAIASAIVKAARRPRVFVSASAVGIYGMFGADAPTVTEDSPPGDDLLAKLCVDWERAADPAAQAGVRVVHPRFGVVLGASGGAIPQMAPAFRWFVGGPVGSGDQWVSWVHERDAARALVLAMDGDLAGPMNVVSPEAVTMNVFAAALARALHRPAMFRVPAFAVRAAFGTGVANVLLTGQRAAPRRLQGAGFSFEAPAIDEAMRRVAADLG
jgi:uncharacterized protein (TIGR01777 family)